MSIFFLAVIARSIVDSGGCILLAMANLKGEVCILIVQQQIGRGTCPRADLTYASLQLIKAVRARIGLLTF